MGLSLVSCQTIHMFYFFFSVTFFVFFHLFPHLRGTTPLQSDILTRIKCLTLLRSDGLTRIKCLTVWRFYKLTVKKCVTVWQFYKLTVNFVCYSPTCGQTYKDKVSYSLTHLQTYTPNMAIMAIGMPSFSYRMFHCLERTSMTILVPPARLQRHTRRPAWPSSASSGFSLIPSLASSPLHYWAWPSCNKCTPSHHS